MSEKQRTLPPWMAKKEVKVKEKMPLKTRRKRKAAARATFYCMNEAELVEAAVSYLTDCFCEDVTSPVGQQFEKEAKDPSATKAKHCISPVTAKPLEEILEDESSDCSTDLETTYVSETDLDTTEVETLPYTRSLKRPESETGSGAAQDDHGLRNTDEGVVKEKQTAEDATEEDDAVQLVREIFFT
ncbi:modulator of retrovirus infection homolog isoform X2 [Austrofundulus limnaeus]|uniref:Modulator of retrovirus infection homolog isoform X2 n=1 Tax=Austrofundulus limnaeus TaxID=52670 RepID=A0A2I4BJ80_AUSLI|nr:PREDICTED: modulator of retrovirus infection homolog isoform X2 [Austrofundulus limnaeus]